MVEVELDIILEGTHQSSWVGTIYFKSFITVKLLKKGSKVPITQMDPNSKPLANKLKPMVIPIMDEINHFLTDQWNQLLMHLNLIYYSEVLYQLKLYLQVCFQNKIDFMGRFWNRKHFNLHDDLFSRSLIRTQVWKWFTLVLYLHYQKATIVHDINLDSKFAINYLESNDIDDLFKSRLTCQILMRWNIQNESPPTQKQNTKPFAKNSEWTMVAKLTSLCTWYIWA